MIDKFPDAQITAIDIAPNMVSKCKQKFNENDQLQFQVMDGENITINQSFDLIVSSMTFQWFENLPKALRDLKEMLNTNGSLYFDLPNKNSFPEWREIIEQNNLESGLISAPIEMGVFETKTYKKQYETGLDFLNKIKKIGAHYSGEGYQGLNPAELRQACKEFDETDRVVSWVIDYCRIEED